MSILDLFGFGEQLGRSLFGGQEQPARRIAPGRTLGGFVNEKRREEDARAAGGIDQSGGWLQYGNQGAIRNRQLNDNLVNSLSQFVPDMGVTVKVFSGGQDRRGQGNRRTGSTRHDDGNAADVFLYKDGRRLDWANPKDRPIFQEFVSRGAQAGITGFGAGPGYMRAGSMHIGFGAPSVWGAGGRSANAPKWLREAYAAGQANAPMMASRMPQQQPERQFMETSGAINDPHARALLDAIAGPESSGKYNIRYTPQGGTYFDSYAAHPGIMERGPYGPSSAAGRYQFTKSTWNDLGGGDFSPENQDRKALELAQQRYSKATGGGDLMAEIRQNGLSNQVISALGPTWHGLKDNPQVAQKWFARAMQSAAPQRQPGMPPVPGLMQRPTVQQPRGAQGQDKPFSGLPNSMGEVSGGLMRQVGPGLGALRQGVQGFFGGLSPGQNQFGADGVIGSRLFGSGPLAALAGMMPPGRSAPGVGIGTGVGDPAFQGGQRMGDFYQMSQGGGGAQIYTGAGATPLSITMRDADEARARGSNIL